MCVSSTILIVVFPEHHPLYKSIPKDNEMKPEYDYSTNPCIEFKVKVANSDKNRHNLLYL